MRGKYSRHIHWCNATDNPYNDPKMVLSAGTNKRSVVMCLYLGQSCKNVSVLRDLWCFLMNFLTSPSMTQRQQEIASLCVHFVCLRNSLNVELHHSLPIFCLTLYLSARMKNYTAPDLKFGIHCFCVYGLNSLKFPSVKSWNLTEKLGQDST